MISKRAETQRSDLVSQTEHKFAKLIDVMQTL
jgi:hypothetical protein